MALNSTWPQVITLGSASSDITSASYTALTHPPGADSVSASPAIGSQSLRIGVTLNGNSGSVTLRFALHDGTDVYDYIDVVCTATSVSAKSANTGSNYKATVAGTNDRFIDLLGYDQRVTPNLKWSVGPQSYTTVTGGTLYVWATRSN